MFLFTGCCIPLRRCWVLNSRWRVQELMRTGWLQPRDTHSTTTHQLLDHFSWGAVSLPLLFYFLLSLSLHKTTPLNQLGPAEHCNLTSWDLGPISVQQKSTLLHFEVWKHFWWQIWYSDQRQNCWISPIRYVITHSGCQIPGCAGGRSESWRNPAQFDPWHYYHDYFQFFFNWPHIRSCNLCDFYSRFYRLNVLPVTQSTIKFTEGTEANQRKSSTDLLSWLSNWPPT